MDLLNCYKFACDINKDNIDSLHRKMENKNVDSIYVGITNMEVEERFKMHVDATTDIVDSSYNFCELTWYSLYECENIIDKYAYISNKTLDMLRKYISDVYDEKCISRDKIKENMIIYEGDDVLRYYVIWS